VFHVASGNANITFATSGVVKYAVVLVVTKRLKCGHPCIGLCGEICPRWCRKCHKKEVTEIFFGTEDDPKACFIQLQDCGHIFEVTGLNQWMDQQDSGTVSKAVEVQFKCCPKCKTSVRKSLRYGNVIKHTLRDNIMEVV